MKKCILIFDDDTEILLVSKIILEIYNYRVDSRVSCDNIIKDASDVKPDIILMDLFIPNIGGENAVMLMKKHKDIKKIPVILFSANTGIERVCERSNADGFLKKPFDIKALLDVVENILSSDAQ